MRRLMHHMKYGFALRAGAPTAESRDNFLERHFVAEHRAQSNALALKEVLQCCSLRECPWKSIQEKPSNAVKAR
jgi:hypothetical protein